MSQPATSPRKLLLESTVRQDYAPVDSSTLWRWQKAGKFPKPVKLGSLNAYFEDEIVAWQAARAEAR